MFNIPCSWIEPSGIWHVPLFKKVKAPVEDAFQRAKLPLLPVMLGKPAAKTVTLSPPYKN